MKSRWTILGIAVCTALTSAAAAQVPPPPAPPESDLVKDAKQLFSDLTAHRTMIERAEVDDDTIRLQEDILATWDRLLNQAKEPDPADQPPPNQNQSPPQNPDSDQNPQPGQAPPQPMGEPQGDSQTGEQPVEQEGEQNSDGTSDSPGQSTGQPTDQLADQADAEARLREQRRFAQMRQAERERLMKEVWGKLPPRIRQKLLNASDEQYLPEYEDRIKEYFRKLSEPENRTGAD